MAHQAYYLASARAVSYLGRHYLAQQMLGDATEKTDIVTSLKFSLDVSGDLVKNITEKYLKDDQFRWRVGQYLTPGPDLGLYAKVVPGNKRCLVLMHFLREAASSKKQEWGGREDSYLYEYMNGADLEEELKKTDKVTVIQPARENSRGRYGMTYSHRRAIFEGIFSIRFTQKVLSDMGLHDVALSKASAVGFPGFDYMMSFNATTMWETWHRSEGIFSRNHPMFGAVAEWMSSSVAGISLSPTTVGGQELLFWPRFPTHAKILQYASATQGTKRGDAAIAWQFVDLPSDKSRWDNGHATIHLRALIPPGSTAKLRLPRNIDGVTMSQSKVIPNLDAARRKADEVCRSRRRAGNSGHSFNWEYDHKKEVWSKVARRKAIGTPCQSFLFREELDDQHSNAWSDVDVSILVSNRDQDNKGMILDLNPGLYDFRILHWQLVKELPDFPGYDEIKIEDLGPECSDPSTFEWDIADATHLI